MDDVLIGSPSNTDIEEFKSKIKRRYKTKEIGKVKRFIGMEINQTEDYITVCQKSHIKKLLKYSELEMGRSRTTPMEPNSKHTYSSDNSPASEALKIKYRKLIGSLL